MSRVLWLTKKNFSVAQQSVIKRFAGNCGLSSAGIFFGNLHQKVPNMWVKKPKTKNTWIINEAQRGKVIAAVDEYINNIQPDVIVINDESTLGYLTEAGYTSLALCRGSVYYYDNIPVIVMDDFNKTRFVKEQAWICTNDLKKLGRWMEGTQRHEPKFNYTVCSSLSDLDNFYNFSLKSVLISADIETIKQHISCVGYTCLTHDGNIHTFVVPFISTLAEGNCYWETEEDEIYAWEIIKKVHANGAIKVMQNGGSYDSVFFIEYGIPMNNYLLDTQILFHSIWCEAPKKLNFIASICLDYCRYWKDELKGSKEENTPKTKEEWDRYWRYNALDCHNTLLSCMVLIIEYMAKIPWARDNYDTKFSLQVGPALYGSCCGMKVDQRRLFIKGDELLNKHKKALEELRIMCDDPDFNPQSTPQVQSLIYDVLGAQPIKRRGKKSGPEKSVDEKILKLIAIQHPIFDIFIKKLWEVKKPKNNYSKYIEMRLHHGRFKYNLRADGTETGRFASSKFIISYGNNAQNVPETMRDICVADPGYVFFEPDYSQADSHFVAFECADPKMMEVVLDDRDTHCVHAEYFFKVPYDEIYNAYKAKEPWAVHPLEGVRQNTKRLAHGANYRMEGYTCYVTMGHEAAVKTCQVIGFEDAHTWPVKQITNTIGELLKSYSTDLYPGLSIWFQDIVDEAIKNGNIVTCALGNTRLFFGNIREDAGIQREISAQYGQGGTAGIINRTLRNYFYNSSLVNEGVKFTTQTHDSCMFQLPDKKLYLAENILTIMEEPVTIKGRQFVVPADGKIGRSWGPEKSVMLPYYKGITLDEIDKKEAEVVARYR